MINNPDINASKKIGLGVWIEALCVGTISYLETIRSWVGMRPVETISVSEIQAAVECSEPTMVLIDVRSKSERSVSCIPGSVSLSEYLQDEAKYKGLTAVTYCTIGGRSYAWAARLAKRGRIVKNFSDGIVGWCRAGGKLETPAKQPTTDVHTYWSMFHVPAPYRFCTIPESRDDVEQPSPKGSNRS
ncbi:rhodanese-like domain-containing protein [Pirellulaceae bacterium SH449]